MSTPTKRRKTAKVDPAENLAPTAKYVCCRCGTGYSRQKGYFSVSHSPMYRGSGYLPICNECIDGMFEWYRRRMTDREAVRRMCMKLDIYWHDALYDSVEKMNGVNSRLRAYITRTNTVKYVDKNYDSTIDDNAGIVIDTVTVSDKRPDGGYNQSTYSGSPAQLSDECEAQEQEVSRDVIDFWGDGFSPDFYMELERRYKWWTKDSQPDSPASISLYKNICLTEVIIARDAASGKPIKDNVNTLNTLLGSMNLKPTQAKEDIDATLEATPMGVWIKRWENGKPVPEPDPELKDVDKIIRYIEVWFRGHLSKMLGIKNSFSKMYEEEISKMRVENPEYADEDDESMFNDIFGNDGGE